MPKGIILEKEAGLSLAGSYMRGVYNWMCAGLLLTAIVAFMTAQSQDIMAYLVRNQWSFIALAIAEIALVIWISMGISKMDRITATLCFLGYSALNGLTLSVIFIAYDMGSIALAFFSCAGMFAAMSIWGAVTKRDLSGMGSFMLMGLFGIIIASIINIFVGSSMMSLVIAWIGVIVFCGLTAWDTQKLLAFGANAPENDGIALHRGTILGALTLYLDFINLFLMLLRILGNSRN